MKNYTSSKGIYITYTDYPNNYPTWKETENLNGDNCPNTISSAMSQVIININGKWMPTHYYQCLAVKVFIREHLDKMRNIKEYLVKSGMNDIQMKYKFKSPQGGYFYILDKRPDEVDNPNRWVTLQRDDLSESICKLIRPGDSEYIPLEQK